MSCDANVVKLLESINNRLEGLDQKIEELREGQERLEEAVANVSLPGPNYGIEYPD